MELRVVKKRKGLPSHVARALRLVESGRVSVREAAALGSIAPASLYRWLAQLNIEADIARSRYLSALWEGQRK